MMFLLAVLLALQAPPEEERFAYGNVLLRVPEGWKVESKDEGLFLRPADLRKDESYIVIIPPGTKADINLAAGFENTWKQVAGARKIAKKAPEKEIKTEGGVDGLMSVGLMDDADNNRLIVTVALFKPADRFQAVLALTPEDDVFQRYREPFGTLIRSLRFRNVELPAYDLLMSMGYDEKGGKTTVLVLFKDGTCLTLLPRDGLDLLEPAAAKKRHGDSVGTHETKEGAITLRVGSRSETLKPSVDGSFRSAETGQFLRLSTGTGTRLDGRFVLHGGTQTIDFKSDGKFEEQGKPGTYEIYNNTLYLSAAEKGVRKMSFMAMPGPKPEIIYLAWARYRREQLRRRGRGPRHLLVDHVACRLVAAVIDQLRDLHVAQTLDGHGAPGMEAAAGGRIEGRRHVALQDDARPLAVGIGHRNSGEQRLRVGVERPLVEILAPRRLHDLPKVHDRDAVADVLDDREVVRDEQVGDPVLLLQVDQQVHDLRLDRDVERRDGLVADDELRVQDEGAGEADALALSARELVRVAVDVPRIETDLLERLLHPLDPLGLLPDAVDGQAFGHDRADGHPRIERAVGVLEDDLEIAPVAAHLFGRQREQVRAVVPDGSRGGLDEPEEGAPGGGLAAAAFADEAQRFARRDLERDVVHGADVGHDPREHPFLDGKVFLQVADFDQGTAHVS